MNKRIAFVELGLMLALYYIAAKTGEMGFFYAGCFIMGSLAYDIYKVK